MKERRRRFSDASGGSPEHRRSLKRTAKPVQATRVRAAPRTSLSTERRCKGAAHNCLRRAGRESVMEPLSRRRPCRVRARLASIRARRAMQRRRRMRGAVALAGNAERRLPMAVDGHGRVTLGWLPAVNRFALLERSVLSVQTVCVAVTHGERLETAARKRGRFPLTARRSRSARCFGPVFRASARLPRARRRVGRRARGRSRRVSEGALGALRPQTRADSAELVNSKPVATCS